MGFWGMSSEGKDARGKIGDLANYNFGQYKDWAGRANDQWSKGDSLSQPYNDYQTNRMQNGFYSPEELTGFGNRIMPGVESAIGNRWGRLNDIAGSFDRDVIPQTDFAVDTMQRNNQQLAQNIGSNQDILQGNIDKAYGTVDNNVEMLKPGGQMQTAQVARSFAPMIANTAARVRSAGIDPNSPQAASLMRSAENNRARGMDDAAARGMGNYVSASSNAALGRMGATNQNQDTAFARTSDWLKQNTDNALTARNLRGQDWGTRSDIGREMNQNEVSDLGLRDQAYQRGLQWGANDKNERNGGADAIGNQANQDYSRAFQSGNQAQSFGNQASQGYGGIYANEAANAGWGSKMLLGAGLNLATGLATGGMSFLGGKKQPSSPGAGGGWGDMGGW